jgi:hypothetical protein
MSVAKLALPVPFGPTSNATTATKSSRSLRSRSRNAKEVTMRYDTHSPACYLITGLSLVFHAL